MCFLNWHSLHSYFWDTLYLEGTIIASFHIISFSLATVFLPFDAMYLMQFVSLNKPHSLNIPSINLYCGLTILVPVCDVILPVYQ